MKLLPATLAGFAGLLIIAAATATPVDCREPILRSTSPDSRHTLAICPGTGPLPRAPAHAVLRDSTGRIEGVVAIAATTAIPPEPAWTQAGVEMPKLARIDFTGGATMLHDAFWRLRTWLRAIPRDEEFR